MECTTHKNKSIVVDSIVSDFPLHKKAINTYYLSIKKIPKPNLTLTTLSLYATLQTIVFHSKDINAVFCSKFMELKRRIIYYLKDHVKLYCDMSPKEFAHELTKIDTDVKYLFSGDDSILINKHSHVEVDK
ncbi:hypothetical protein A3Q56_05116 [Intoshia linei]|uniref:RNA-dependent RNA polymerase alsuviricetes domain-containing protein n=1 Tax=Intoshia linei TaxID=1819745 RepID=A0A177AYT3_9BILA|nr:hypothetical protein A3Q56_05116 [Intoshia linei]